MSAQANAGTGGTQPPKNGGGKPRNTNQPTSKTATTNFTGATPEMNGHVFMVFAERKDPKAFTKTVEALEDYVVKNLKHAGDIVPIFKNYQTPEVPKPEAIDVDQASYLDKQIFEQDIRNYCNRRDRLKDNLSALYAVIWGQCSESMKAKLKSDKDYTAKELNKDCGWLLTTIKTISFDFDSHKDPFHALTDAYRAIFNYRQSPNDSVTDYLDVFRTKVEVLEHYGGGLGTDPGSKDAATKEILASNSRNALFTDAAEYAKNRFRAMLFLQQLDRSRYQSLLDELRNQYTRGNNQYPLNLVAAFDMVVGYTTPTNRPTKKNDAPAPAPSPAPSNNPAVMFTQTATTGAPIVPTPPTPTTDASVPTALDPTANPVPGSDSVLHPHITCYRCRAMGHYADRCPTMGVQLFQHASFVPGSAVMFTQHGNQVTIPPSWVLLDSQSTVSVFHNAALLQHIREAPHQLNIHSNGGSITCSQVGDLPNFGTVWFSPHSIANILSLADVRRVCRITMDSAIEPAITVHKRDGSYTKFVEYESGLYFFDTATSGNTTSLPVAPYYSLLQTVANQKAQFTRREVEGANLARDLYRKLGRPAQKTFESILTQNLIRNCPVTVDDAKRAVIIYGPDAASIKGTMTKHKPTAVPTTNTQIMLPDYILEHHRNVTLCLDIFFVHGLPFLHSISRKINFRTVAPLANRQKTTILKETKGLLSIYDNRGFNVTDAHADNEFKPIEPDFPNIKFNFVAADDHVPEVERSVRTIKDKVRTTVHGLPYRRMPRLMIRHLVGYAVSCINMFPAAEGVSTTMSPTMLLTGRPNPDYNQLKLEFGSYVHVLEPNDPTNTTKSRTVGEIALTSTGNAQGDYYFMSLATGEQIIRHKYTVLPISTEVINKVEEFAIAQKQPIITNTGLLFEWEPNVPILDDDTNSDHDLLAAASGTDVPTQGAQEEALLIDLPQDQDIQVIPPADDIAPENLGADVHGNLIDEVEEHLEDVQGAAEPEQEEHNEQADADPLDQDDDHFVPAEAILEAPQNPFPNDEVAEEPVPEVAEEPALAEEAEPPVEILPNTRELRPNRERNYNHLFNNDAFLFTQTSSQIGNADTCAKLVAFIFTQMSAKVGIQKHGKAALEALFKEFAQLEDQSVFEAVQASSLTPEQKAAALRLVNLIKEKRNGILKGRSCVDGSSQRTLYSKEETTSPTLSAHAFLLSLLIDATEGRDAATADVVGAYLNAFMDDYVLIKVTGQIVDVMCQVNPIYKQFVTIEKGRKVLYVKLVKALYGCVKSALLWYELFASTLTNLGFKRNPYEPCVANAIIKGHQCTICWYVDDMKVSHPDPEVVSDIIERIESRFGKMTVKRGKNHEFLGMTCTFNDDKTVSIDMSRYLHEAMQAFGEDVSTAATSPGGKNLFSVDETSPRLTGEKAERFHSIVAKLLYISQRGRPDLAPTVAFLCTRVAKSTQQDWGKLKRLMQYINDTIDLKLTLGADSLSTFTTWVDAAYAVHPDMKSHTGGAISLGRGTMIY